MYSAVIPARREHIDAIVPHVRAADVIELRAAGGYTPAAAMAVGLELSTRAWTVMYDATPVAMAGVAALDVLNSSAVPWMVATDHVEAQPRPFLRLSRHYVAQMADWYGRLWNYVDTRNTVAIRYLEWLGFTVGEPAGLFRPFELRRPVCADR